jgi:hypothetical protein
MHYSYSPLSYRGSRDPVQQMRAGSFSMQPFAVHEPTSEDMEHIGGLRSISLGPLAELSKGSPISGFGEQELSLYRAGFQNQP